MDAAVTGVAMAALVADGLLAGLSLDKVIVQLPARRRIGVTAYAAYARAADLGNGIVFYAAVGVGAAVLTLAAFAVAATLGASGTVTGLLAAAAALSLLYSAATGRAAPTMFQIGRAGDTEAALTPLLTRFTRWSAARAALQTATLIVVAIAIAAGT
jgi:membrane associated rhomboid family serine protease